MVWICIVSILNCKFVNENFHMYFMIYIGIMQWFTWNLYISYFCAGHTVFNIRLLFVLASGDLVIIPCLSCLRQWKIKWNSLFSNRRNLSDELCNSQLPSHACYTGNFVYPVWPQKCRSGVYWPSVCHTVLQYCDQASWIFYHYYICSSRPVICFSFIFFEADIKN